MLGEIKVQWTTDWSLFRIRFAYSACKQRWAKTNLLREYNFLVSMKMGRFYILQFTFFLAYFTFHRMRQLDREHDERIKKQLSSL